VVDLAFSKGIGGQVIPADPATVEAWNKIKLGEVVRADFKRARNPKFHRKYFALLNLAFDHWNPELPEIHGMKAEKSFEQFRKDLTILAGYYTVSVRLNGEARVEAKSISFASMDEAEFEKLYSATIDVILKRVMQWADREEIERLVDQILLEFA